MAVTTPQQEQSVLAEPQAAAIKPTRHGYIVDEQPVSFPLSPPPSPFPFPFPLLPKPSYI